MSKVYVANVAGHDFTGLKKYGEIVAITKGHVSFGSLDRMAFDVAVAVRDAERDDYLAVSGAAIINVTAAIVWYQKHKRVRLLNYDKKTGEYREMVLTADSLELIHAITKCR